MARYHRTWRSVACAAVLLAGQMTHQAAVGAPQRIDAHGAAQASPSVTIYSSGFRDIHSPLHSAGLDSRGLPFVHTDWQLPYNEVDYQIFAQLVEIDRRGHPLPDLLRDVPTLSNREVVDGGKTVILRLKPHLFWSSGAPLTSADIQFGWQAAVVKDCGEAAASCGPIASVSLRGPAVAALHLKQPYSPLVAEDLPAPLPHSYPAFRGSPLVAAQRLRTQGLFDTNMWTDGPYRVQRPIERNSYLDEVVFADATLQRAPRSQDPHNPRSLRRAPLGACRPRRGRGQRAGRGSTGPPAASRGLADHCDAVVRARGTHIQRA